MDATQRIASVFGWLILDPEAAMKFGYNQLTSSYRLSEIWMLVAAQRQLGVEVDSAIVLSNNGPELWRKGGNYEVGEDDDLTVSQT
jgi:hypothetical protein